MFTEQDSFQKAADDVKVLKTKPDKSELGELYALYKQATVGDVNFGGSLSSVDHVETMLKEKKIVTLSVQR